MLGPYHWLHEISHPKKVCHPKPLPKNTLPQKEWSRGALLEWETTAPTRQSQLQACSSKARDWGWGASTLIVREDQTFHRIFVFPWRLEVNLSEEGPPKKKEKLSPTTTVTEKLHKKI